jgi:retinol dehydrogenase-12
MWSLLLSPQFPHLGSLQSSASTMGQKGVLTYILDRFRRVPDVVRADLTNKTVIVVGANTGLGFEAAQHFAKMNPGRLILACRSEQKGRAAVNREFMNVLVISKYLIRVISNAGLKANTGYSNVKPWLVDLSRFSSVRTFADRAMDLERLDILLLNAAVLPRENGFYTSTSGGWEATCDVICPIVGH